MSEDRRIVVNISRWQAVVGLVLALLALGGTAWSTAAKIIEDKAERAVRDQVIKVGLVTARDQENMRALLDLRLQVLEKAAKETNERVEFIYRRELDRSRKE